MKSSEVGALIEEMRAMREENKKGMSNFEAMAEKFVQIPLPYAVYADSLLKGIGIEGGIPDFAEQILNGLPEDKKEAFKNKSSEIVSLSRPEPEFGAAKASPLEGRYSGK